MNQRQAQAETFHLLEATLDHLEAARGAGELTTRELVELYLKRIEAYDQEGPAINSIITVNPKALDEADRLDALRRASGSIGPLHGIPVIIKDQIDAQGMPTSIGSTVLNDVRWFPSRAPVVGGEIELGTHGVRQELRVPVP